MRSDRLATPPSKNRPSLCLAPDLISRSPLAKSYASEPMCKSSGHSLPKTSTKTAGENVTVSRLAEIATITCVARLTDTSIFLVSSNKSSPPRVGMASSALAISMFFNTVARKMVLITDSSNGPISGVASMRTSPAALRLASYTMIVGKPSRLRTEMPEGERNVTPLAEAVMLTPSSRLANTSKAPRRSW